jgi:hypothetical protein
MQRNFLLFFKDSFSSNLLHNCFFRLYRYIVRFLRFAFQELKKSFELLPFYTTKFFIFVTLNIDDLNKIRKNV